MQKHSYSFDAIGTQWTIETAAQLPKILIAEVQSQIAAFDATYSRFRKDSLVTQAALHEGVFVFPHHAVPLFDFYHALYTLTDGRMTPLIGSMLEKAGYDADYSLQPREQTMLPSWDEVLDWKGAILKTTQPVTLDVGAAGKGYLVDLVSHVLEKAGINEYVVDASGDFRHRGVRENNVGLEHPSLTGKIIGVIDVQNKSLCASASNRRAWGEGMHHIFDPATMRPTQEIIATWVIADDTMTADGIATALFFAEPNRLLKQFSFEYARLHSSGAIDYSPAFEGKLF